MDRLRDAIITLLSRMSRKSREKKSKLKGAIKTLCTPGYVAAHARYGLTASFWLELTQYQASQATNPEFQVATNRS